MSDVLTVEDLANEYGVAKSTIYSGVRKGTIPAVRFGSAVRFRREVIESWVRSQEARASGRG